MELRGILISLRARDPPNGVSTHLVEKEKKKSIIQELRVANVSSLFEISSVGYSFVIR